MSEPRKDERPPKEPRAHHVHSTAENATTAEATAQGGHRPPRHYGLFDSSTEMVPVGVA